MTLPALPDLDPTPLAGSVDVSNPTADLPALVFAREVTRRGLTHLVVRALTAAHSEVDLPPGHELVIAVDGPHAQDHVAVVGDLVLWLDSWSDGGRVVVAGDRSDAARALADALATRALDDPGRVSVEFADQRLGSRHVDLAVRPWAEIAHLYPPAVARAMGTLVDHVPTPDGPRLLLWHGRPGTGKTTALRALLDAWRSWVSPVVVGDPESLMADGRYLRRILLDADDETWRLVVMEDAEALLCHTGSRGPVSTMLNLADGLLGQGLRCLFLLTTNLGVSQVHPALLRPGRCLSLLEFGPLPTAQAAALGGTAGRPMTLAEVMSREVEQVWTPDDSRGHLYL